MTSVLLLGADDLGRSVAEAVRAMDAAGQRMRLVGFLDDTAVGERRDGVPVIAGLEGVEAHPEALLVICADHATAGFEGRRTVRERLAHVPDDRFGVVVDPRAVVPQRHVLPPGTIVLAGAVLLAAVAVAPFVLVMPATVVMPRVTLGAYCTLEAGVRVGAGAHIGEAAHVGMGAVIREGVRVGHRALVGMGSVVLGDVPDDQIWAGVPARPLRRRARTGRRPE